MTERHYYSMFKNEKDVLTVPEVIRLLRIGKNSVYALIKEGKIKSIKQGKKIIVPKVCLVDFLTNEENYQTPSPSVTNNRWTSANTCDSLSLAREKTKDKPSKKGA